MANETVTARVTRHLQAEPAKVFQAWLDPELLRKWMEHSLQSNGLPGEVREVEVDAREGGRFHFSDLRDEEEARAWGTYRTIDEPRELQFTWFATEEDEREDSSLVTILIEPSSSGGSDVTLEHEMAQQWASHTEQVESSWGYMLEAIDAILR